MAGSRVEGEVLGIVASRMWSPQAQDALTHASTHRQRRHPLGVQRQAD